MKTSPAFAALLFAAFISTAASGEIIASGQTVFTDFNTSDGFITGPINGAAPALGAFDPVTVSNDGFEVTFSGGQQQQAFDSGSYNNGPAGYLFVNTGPGTAVFTGGSGNTITGGANNGDQTGVIDFNIGATDVSFFAANRANGPNSTLDIFGTDGSLLLEDFVIGSGQVENQFFEFTSEQLGGLIGQITFDLPGPNANAPYVLAIDTFSATAVPEPAALFTVMSGMALLGLRRRR